VNASAGSDRAEPFAEPRERIRGGDRPHAVVIVETVHRRHEIRRLERVTEQPAQQASCVSASVKSPMPDSLGRHHR
jgi:hypothetical protein